MRRVRTPLAGIVLLRRRTTLGPLNRLVAGGMLLRGQGRDGHPLALPTALPTLVEDGVVGGVLPGSLGVAERLQVVHLGVVNIPRVHLPKLLGARSRAGFLHG